ncbi:MAG: multiubiquitin domain-containing protein [Caldilineaceae bacterium]|nr:multiubiquitin domain-containing protein [Caldilineaceae bacterium]
MAAENRLTQDALDKSEVGTPDFDKPEDDKSYSIKIDRTEYVVNENRLTGADLRKIPKLPIPPDRDLFQIIPGRPDKKIKDEDRILITDGLRFFTAPNTINPGICSAG